MHPLVIPPTAFGAQAVIQLPESPPRIARHDVTEHGDDGRISPRRRHRRLVVRRPRMPHHATGAHHELLLRAVRQCLTSGDAERLHLESPRQGTRTVSGLSSIRILAVDDHPVCAKGLPVSSGFSRI
jgi:hypothetical protein